MTNTNPNFKALLLHLCCGFLTIYFFQGILEAQNSSTCFLDFSFIAHPKIIDSIVSCMELWDLSTACYAILCLFYQYQSKFLKKNQRNKTDPKNFFLNDVQDTLMSVFDDSEVIGGKLNKDLMWKRRKENLVQTSSVSLLTVFCSNFYEGMRLIHRNLV